MSGLVFLIVAQIVVSLVCTEMLLRNLPKAIRESIEANCRRLDGSWSRHRERVEKRAVAKVRRSLWFACVLVLLPTNMLLHYVHTEIIPLSLGLDAMRTVRMDSEEWKGEIKTTGIEARFNTWHANQPGKSNQKRQPAKRMLWNAWPTLAFGFVVWLLFSAYVFKSLYLASLKQLATGVRSRAQHLTYRDLTRMSEAPQYREKVPYNAGAAHGS